MSLELQSCILQLVNWSFVSSVKPFVTNSDLDWLHRQVRQMEAVVAGALRREQAADAVTKRLAGEIEHLNRLVHQREADTQSGKMILRFREDKIRRLETLSKGLLSVDSYRAEEMNLLMEEIQLMREKIDRNPELTRFAMENIRLVDQIRRYDSSLSPLYLLSLPTIRP